MSDTTQTTAPRQSLASDVADAIEALNQEHPDVDGALSTLCDVLTGLNLMGDMDARIRECYATYPERVERRDEHGNG